MMRYLLNGFLSDHYRATDNRWQTVAEIVEATQRKEKTVRNALNNLRSAGRLQIQDGPPKRFRVMPDMLHRESRLDPVNPTPELAAPKRDVERIRRDFCRRWKVTVPYQATMRSDVAMREWLEMLRS